jgi:hypothetical protein
VDSLECRALLASFLAGPSVIDYPVGPVQHENVFAQDLDGTLRLDYWDGSHWNWANLQHPTAALVASEPSVSNYQVGSTLHENVFVRGSDGNLYLDYWNGSNWNWANLGNPGSGVQVYGAPKVINYPVGSVIHENVFVRCSDTHLHLDFWDGSKWTWVDLANPGVAVTNDQTVINYQVGSTLHENVFTTGFDGKLYLDYWDGSKWTWAPTLGNPGTSLLGDPAAINYQVGSTVHENVFVRGGDGKLYLDYWDGSKWNWAPTLGNPGVSLYGGDPSVVNYPVGSTVHENIFITVGGNLYLDYWDGSKWNWAPSLGNPGGGVSVFGDTAASNYQVGSVLHENAYVPGNDGSLDLDYWDGSKWNWVNLGAPLAPSHLSLQSQSAQESLIDEAIASLAPLTNSKKHLEQSAFSLPQPTLLSPSEEVFRP